MTKEEKKAIKYFYNLRATIDESYMLFNNGINVKCEKEMLKQISTVLNLIQKQQEEIDEMAEELSNQYRNYEPCDLDGEMNCKKYKTCKECIKQYFEKKVEDKQWN